MLRDELRRERGLDFAVRIGVNTGRGGDRRAARARARSRPATRSTSPRGWSRRRRPGEILLGRDTFRLVRHAVDAEPVAPLAVKGKCASRSRPTACSPSPRDAQARAPRPRAPMVGRQRERRRLLDAFHQAVADRSCQLFTVLGAAGVGKSRLVRRGAGDDRRRGDRGGRPLPALRRRADLVAARRGAGRRRSAASARRPTTARPPRAWPSCSSRRARRSRPEEAFWAVRKVLEASARRHPLVLVVDDLQWAEPTFVDLIEHVAEWTRDAPLLLLIMARPELLDARPGWGGGKLNATTVLLEPLPETDARDLLGHLIGPARLEDRAAARILGLAEGNPLFVEEVVAMLIDDGACPRARVTGRARPS